MIQELERIVVALATEAGRMVGTAGHAAARRHLLHEVRAHGLIGYHEAGFEFPYDYGDEQITNVVAVLPGTDPGLAPVLLAAHYDTCGIQPGADDNAAAIAVLFALVEPLRAARLARSVIFAFFDAEEPPYYKSLAMGSMWFYRHQRREPIHCALVLDLVGHDVPLPGFAHALFVTGMESDPELETVFRATAGGVRGIAPVPTLTRYIGDMSDYRPFRLDRRPYLFFSCGQWQHYHMPTDTPEKLNYHKMAAITAWLADVTVAVAGASLRGPFEGYDTTATEIECFRAIGGPLLQQLGLDLRTRADLDILVPRLADGLLSC